MKSIVPHISCPRLLQALESKLRGTPHHAQPMYEQWSQDVVRRLQEGSPAKRFDVETMLSIAASALRHTMLSKDGQVLLQRTLQQPRAFANTLLLIMYGSLAPAQART